MVEFSSEQERQVYLLEMLEATHRKLKATFNGSAPLEDSYDLEVKVRMNGHSANEDQILIMRTRVDLSTEGLMGDEQRY